MSTERSDRVYEAWLQATSKFDYFVAGVALTLASYLASSLKGFRLDPSPDGLEVVSVVFVFGSALASLKRIDAMNVTLKLSHAALYAQESAGELTNVAQAGVPAFNRATGQAIDPHSALYAAKLMQQDAKDVEEDHDRWVRRGRRWKIWRDRLLLAGLFLLIAARVWSPTR